MNNCKFFVVEDSMRNPYESGDVFISETFGAYGQAKEEAAFEWAHMSRRERTRRKLVILGWPDYDPNSDEDYRDPLFCEDYSESAAWSGD